MATLSFTASNGKRYSLLSLPNKLTTPSLKVGSSYVPCFVGSAESEVTSGEYVYTLSPMKVGDTHAAYKRKLSFEAIGHVYIQVKVCGLLLGEYGMPITTFNGYFQRIYTDIDGYTAHATFTSTNQGSVGPAIWQTSQHFYWNGTYTVTHDATGETVDSGTFSVGATAGPGLYAQWNCSSPTFTIK